MKETFRWGIIGLGGIANKFAQSVANVKGASINAVASRSLEKAKLFADNYNVPHALGSYNEILNPELVDAVYIATPHVLHHENTIACLKNKIPVLCEKPMAINRRQVEEMIETARTQNVFLMEAMWTRFLPGIRKVEEFINGGKLGALKTLRADFCFRAPGDPDNRLFNKSLGGGALLDIGIYPIFLSLLYFGKPLGFECFSHLTVRGVDESTAMILHYDGGKIASLFCSFMVTTSTDVEIAGELGIIRFGRRFFSPTFIEYSDHKNTELIYEPHDHLTGYEYEIEEVMQCIKQGKIESPLLSWNFSLDLITLLDEIRKKCKIKYVEDE